MKNLLISSLFFFVFGASVAQSVAQGLPITKQELSKQNGLNSDNSSLRSPGGDDLPLNGSGFLGQTYNQTLCGLSYVQSSKMITTRYTPDPGTGWPCVLPISGLPTCAVIEKAYLYWIVSYGPGSSTAPIVNLSNPASATGNYTATMIGQSGPKCWVETGSRSFRADVTAAVSGNGNYTINNVVGNTVWEMDGATLFIIYRNPTATWKGSLILDDGIVTRDTYVSAFNHTMTGFTACGAGTSSKAFLICSDLQNNIDTSFTADLNGTTQTFPKDFYNFAEVNTSVTAGQTTSDFNFSQTVGECFSFAVAGLYFQTTTCGPCSSPGGMTASNTEIPSSCSLCNGSATVTPSGGTSPYTYSWSTTPIQTTATATALCAGTYTVTVVDATGCLNATVVSTITSTSSPVINVNSPSICAGQTASLTASGATSFSWSAGVISTGTSTAEVSPLATTTYTVTGTSSGCSGTTTFTVTVNSAPTLNINSPSICAGGTASLSASGCSNYVWSTGDLVPSISVSPTSSTSYSVTGTTGGCTVTGATTVTVSPSPSVALSSDIYSGCAPLCVNFYDGSNISGGSIVSWSWNFGGDGSSTQQNPKHCFQNPGTYSVSLSVTSSNGCSSSYTFLNMIEVFPVPTAEFMSSPNPASTNDPTIHFTDASSSDAISWTWDLGDGTLISPNEENPEHTYSAQASSYIVTLIVQNEGGCLDTVSHEVHILGEFAFYIPNSFTPNADGKNDSFNGKGVGINAYDLWIFDRWGNRIFHSDALDRDWDGKANNGSEIAQQDVYVWKVKLTDIYEKEHHYTGIVTLIK